MLALFMVSIVRSLLASERLALIEVAVSFAIAFLITYPRKLAFLKTPARTVFAYCVAWAGLVAGFAAFEFSRSWARFYAETFDGTLLDFAAQRLLGYYATALNNSALAMEVAPGGITRVSALFQGSAADSLGIGPRFDFGTVLQQSSNPEFNNSSGLLVPTFALGAIGGMLLLVAVALGIAIAAVLASRGSIMGILTYSVVAVAVLELVRFFYLGATRAWPIFIGLVALFLISRAENRKPNAEVKRIRKP